MAHLVAALVAGTGAFGGSRLPFDATECGLSIGCDLDRPNVRRGWDTKHGRDELRRLAGVEVSLTRPGDQASVTCRATVTVLHSMFDHAAAAYVVSNHRPIPGEGYSQGGLGGQIVQVGA